MISEININRSYPPGEVADYLRNRGWFINGDGTMLNYSRNNGEVMEWSEALAYEMFMHLYHMAPGTNQPLNGSENGKAEG